MLGGKGITFGLLKKISFYILLASLALWQLEAKACTLFAAAGDALANGGTAITKNRDTVDNHDQELRWVNSPGQHSYLGLFAVNAENNITYSPLKAGVNERGLVVTFATANSVPKNKRYIKNYSRDLAATWLKNYGSVDEVLANLHLYKGVRILLIADKEKVARIEMGPQGEVGVTVTESGTLVAANHFVEPETEGLNESLGSKERWRLVNQLLQDSLPLQSEDFTDISQSIWREGQSTKTLSAFTVVHNQKEFSALVEVRENNQVFVKRIDLSTIKCQVPLTSKVPNL